jgi:hypothetical protein
MPHTLSFTDEETALLTDARIFLKKARITEKVRRHLEAARAALQVELGRTPIVTPSDFDLGCVQFVKGEHLENFPYQYLDFPKHFRSTEKCTFRTLVWWGHHVVMAWILEGPLMKQYKKNLFDRYHAVAGRELELSIAPTLWEWKRGEGYTLPITHDRKAPVAAVLAERSFFKVARFVPLDDPRFLAGGLAELSVEAFVAMKPILSP